MKDPIVPGYFCTMCSTGFDQSDQKKPWERHRTMPLTGLNLKVGEVFGYGANSPLPDWSMVVTTDPVVCPVDHERTYGFALIPVNEGVAQREEPVITTPSKFRSGRVYEFDPKQYELFLNAFKKVDSNFRYSLLTIIRAEEIREGACFLSQDKLFALPLPLTRGIISRE